MLFVLIVRLARVPPIHDLTTDPRDPPQFRERLAAEGDMSYPRGGGDVPDLQRRAYPDLQPIRVDAGVDEAFRRARLAAEQLGWTITWSRDDALRFEARQRSGFFRFLDLVAVRVREAPGGALVDVRSTSRVERNDLGSNAGRIRAFRDALASSVGPSAAGVEQR